MQKTIVIIGASRGIGLELARQYVQLGHNVIATCRTSSKALESLNCEIINGIDVADDGLLDNISNLINAEHIDVLIHNAGVLVSDTYSNIDFNNMRYHFEVNALAALKTVIGLSSKLRQGSKVGIVSSRVGSIQDNSSSNNYAYRVSKTAVNMIGKCLSIDLAAKGIALAMLHPGYVRTDMTANNGLIEVDESARGLIKIMDELSLNTSGRFKHTNGEDLPW